jgi:tetratricopeptide (TPR) repeat protein
LRRLGEYEHAIARGRVGRDLARGIRHWLHLVQNLREIAAAAIAARDHECALECLMEMEESRRIATVGDVLPLSELARNQLVRGYFHHINGDLADARRCYEEIDPELLPSNYQAAVLLGALSLDQSLSRKAKQSDEARNCLERAIKLCEDLLEKSPAAFDAAYHLARANLVLARLVEAHGRIDESLEQYETAYAYAKATLSTCRAKGVLDEELRFLELIGDTLPHSIRFAAALKAHWKLFTRGGK